MRSCPARTPPSDERILIDEVTAQEGFVVRRIGDAGAGRWFLELDPCRHPQSTHARERHILPVAQADAVTTMLSGRGGDERSSCNGRAVPTHLVRSGRWMSLWRHTAARSRIRSSGPTRRETVMRSFVMEVHDGVRPRTGPFTRDRRPLVADAAELEQVSPLAADLVRRKSERIRTATDHHSYQLALLNNGHLQHRCGWWHQTGRLFGIDYRYPRRTELARRDRGGITSRTNQAVILSRPQAAP